MRRRRGRCGCVRVADWGTGDVVGGRRVALCRLLGPRRQGLFPLAAGFDLRLQKQAAKEEGGELSGRRRTLRAWPAKPRRAVPARGSWVISKPAASSERKARARTSARACEPAPARAQRACRGFRRAAPPPAEAAEPARAQLASLQVARQAMDGAQASAAGRWPNAPQERRALASAGTRWRPFDIAQIARREARTADGGDGAAMHQFGGMVAAAPSYLSAGADTAGARNLCVMSRGRR